MIVDIDRINQHDFFATNSVQTKRNRRRKKERIDSVLNIKRSHSSLSLSTVMDLLTQGQESKK